MVVAGAAGWRKVAVALLVAAGLTAASACTETTNGRSDENPKRPPNVLVIMTDDQPLKDTMSVMPHTRRWFGEQGTEFTNAYVTTPVCCPSRATFFSGRYVHNHDVIRNTPGNAQKLEQDSTIQRYLGDQGYLRAVYGKYLNGWNLKKDPPHFDDWAINEGGKPLGYYNGPWNVNGKLRKKVKTYSTTFVQRHSLRFLDEAERDDDRPWVMFVHPYAPHLPFLLPDRYRDAEVPEWEPDPSIGEQDVSDKPPFARRIDNPAEYGADLREQQLRTLIPVDKLVNKVMTKLEDLGEADNTLAFYSSDNGYLWGDHQLERKSEPYRGAVQVPMYARWPGVVEAGGTDDSIVANIDVAPTIYDAAGVEPDRRWPVDGTSLLGDDDRDDILLEYWQELPDNDAYVSWAAIRTDDYLYVEYYEKDLATVRFREYYDLQQDPWELENLFGDDDPTNDPDTAAIERRLQELRRCEGRSCR